MAYRTQERSKSSLVPNLLDSATSLLTRADWLSGHPNSMTVGRSSTWTRRPANRARSLRTTKAKNSATSRQLPPRLGTSSPSPRDLTQLSTSMPSTLPAATRGMRTTHSTTDLRMHTGWRLALAQTQDWPSWPPKKSYAVHPSVHVTDGSTGSNQTSSQ